MHENSGITIIMLIILLFLGVFAAGFGLGLSYNRSYRSCVKVKEKITIVKTSEGEKKIK